MSDQTPAGIQYPTTEALIEHLNANHGVFVTHWASRDLMLQGHERLHSRPAQPERDHQHREEWR